MENTEVEVGDVVVCTISIDEHFIEGNEYKVYADGCGDPMLLTENKQRFAIKPRQEGYCCTNTGSVSNFLK